MALNGKPKNSDKTVFTDERTRQKMDKHLSDINDEITEEDIANVKTNVTPNTEDNVDEAEEILQRRRKEEEDKAGDEDGNNSNNIQTPWNIMDNK